MSGWRRILFPFSVVYGAGVWLRNRAFDAGWKRSEEFDLPVICVGNLEVGGAGKTPMTEYLVRLLKNKGKTGTLSRGYGRKTKGFILANARSTAAEIGDEPAQFKRKFPEITVAVDEDRVHGIRQIKNDLDIIILDDAYQHRAVNAGFNILLFDYRSLFHPRFLLPAGNWRDRFSERKRADVIVVTKCPDQLSAAEKQGRKQLLQTRPDQPVFFSSLQYGALQPLFGPENASVPDLHNAHLFVLTGIANPEPLLAYLRQKTPHIYPHSYPDHHTFSAKNISKLVGELNGMDAAPKYIITTEKDAQRLQGSKIRDLLKNLPIFVQPVETVFQDTDGAAFNRLIEHYVTEHSQHRRIH
ncbi:MAG: tetraacyldisaccharide 4'-kinase [Mucilaginibacter polytrichastri]|nr:tetraacyldisaccharide 4'-kinase [Mucilaginibacter polytrichastri]